MFTVCPHCGTEFEVEKEWAGEQTQCLSCGMKFIISKKSEPVLKPVLKPVSHQKNVQITEHGKKDILLFCFVFPVFFFLLFLLSPMCRKIDVAIVILPCWAALIFGARSVIIAETGIKDAKKLWKWILLLFPLFPIGFIAYADLRKTCGLSNIMPWAVITAIINGLLMIVHIYMLLSMRR